MNFDTTGLALAAVCPSNKMITDDKGMPSIYVQVAYDQLSFQPQAIWSPLPSVHTHPHVADSQTDTLFTSLCAKFYNY